MLHSYGVVAVSFPTSGPDKSLIPSPPIPPWLGVIPFEYGQAVLISDIREFVAMAIHLRCFVAVAEALSFTKAAVMVRLAQSCITRHIKKLEGKLGVLLLSRTKHDVSLIDEGHPFLTMLSAS
jgi:Bacterial regulatory helix-turn-helix protein, lysR family